MLSVDVGYIENADALAGLIGDVNSDIAAIQRTGNGFPMKTAYALSKKVKGGKITFLVSLILFRGREPVFYLNPLLIQQKRKSWVTFYHLVL